MYYSNLTHQKQMRLGVDAQKDGGTESVGAERQDIYP